MVAFDRWGNSMEIIFIRHGEPDYAPCDERGFIGHGRALAPLSARGVTQAARVAAHGGVIRRLTGEAGVMYCTPYVVQYKAGYEYYQWVD